MEFKEGEVVDIWQKVGTPKGLCLNLGCGNDVRDGWINVDKYNDLADVDWDFFKLPLKDNSVTAIACLDVLEHFSKFEVPILLKEWCRVLMPGGTLYLIVPDIIHACKCLIEDPENEIFLNYIYGLQTTPGQFHKTGFTPKRILTPLFNTGFGQMNVIGYLSSDGCSRYLVEAIK